MRRSGPGYEKFSIDRDYHGFSLYTDGKQFFAEDDDGNESARADTLAAVKAQLLKPTKVNIKAIILAGDGFRDESTHRTITVYGVSGTGALLYQTADGSKDKSNRWEIVRPYDSEKLARYDALCKGIERLTKHKDELLEQWKPLDADELRNGGSK